MLGRRVWAVAWVLACWGLSDGPDLRAQVGSGALTGTVADQSRAAVPDAAITVVGSSTGQSRVAVSGLDGGYLVSSLIPGEFDVRIEVNGFRTLTRKGVRVAAGETVRLDVVLTVGAVSEEVRVLGDGSPLRSATASLG